ncbi:glycosyltransferase involved in cell wall biosynthesis [Actinoplanes campanulatus]|uniref:Glycosyltransferase involved in cell wall biosynthesis n=1 Tax=Actinoplanes campanulatus TaxID=113559 RepID=A0A7W5AIF3_9ACTN|nr:glycosyltransferase [Actinoplanes campanulatus]MBB3096858.1 glycosyltransferase involved in cell wall biosynthesis [Actinoplanes campanulatus]GGN44571.1 glycosyl transferase [Actinoplanes campanulatus]GID37402.1 glycosyl transferase [Actinoplanes campanulatus]
MNILLWHVHGSWTTSFVQGKHRYLVPVNPARDEWGRGRARTFDWPDTVEELPLDEIRDVDVAIAQRPGELDLIPPHVPVIYVEHNTPKGDVPDTRHPLADRDDLVIAHVTDFNDLFWDCGGTRTTVIEHGVVEPAARWTGSLSRLAVVTNEPVRRGRVTGTDLFPRFASVAPLDVFGMGVSGLAGVTAFEDPPQHVMHAEVARRRAYLHLCRWTSLGLSLIEAMQMGMPVLALATTEAIAAVPPDAGILSTRVDTLVEAARRLIDEPGEAAHLGARARQVALARYGIDRFLADWDRLLEEETCASR